MKILAGKVMDNSSLYYFFITEVFELIIEKFGSMRACDLVLNDGNPNYAIVIMHTI